MPRTAVRPRSMTVRVLAAASAGAVVVAVAGAASIPLGATGCTTHQCDTSQSDFTGGVMVDSTTFVTSDLDADWMDYPGEATIHVHFPPGLTRPPSSILGQVGDGLSPNGGADFQGGDAWTPASGQLAELFFVDETGFYVTNATCQHYNARFTARFPTPSLTLFGGSAGGTSLGDTWTWDGTQWSAAGTGPGPASGTATDATGNRTGASSGTLHVTTPDPVFGSGTYVFGGLDSTPTASPPYSFETWQWDGVSWNLVYTAHWPSGRADAASAVLGAQMLVFGGSGPDPVSGAVGDLGDLWAFTGNGGDWTELAPASSGPGARSGASAAT
ncbi:MAG: hypothetical protein ACRELB_03750, partial [Polyangiaceae bacterium]